jgi:hypothetical protein
MQYQTFEHDDKMVGFKSWLVSYLKDNPIKKGDSVRVEIPARFNATCAWRLTTLKVNDFVFEDGESRLVDRFQLDIAICPDLAIIDTNKFM